MTEPRPPQRWLAAAFSLTGGGRFHASMAVIVTALFLADQFLVPRAGLHGAGEKLSGLLYLIPFAVICVYCSWRGFERLFDVLSIFVWSCALGFTMMPFVPLAARTAAPLIDQSLARLDRMVVDTATIVQWVSRFSTLNQVLTTAYRSVPPFVITALFLPAVIGLGAASRRFLLSVALAVLITLGLFAVWPAAGPWTTEGLTPTQSQSEITAYLLALKTGQPMDIDYRLGGIVAFPSFHTALAILAALALRRIRFIRWFALGLAVAVCISTVTTGWHYLVDVLGGLGVAWLVDTLAGFVVTREDPRTRLLS